jgi:hypothetical protein
MKKLLLALTFTIVSAVGFAQHKSDMRPTTPPPPPAAPTWKAPLEADVSKRFELSPDIAKKVVAIKEKFRYQVASLNYPQRQLDQEAKEKMKLELKTKEFEEVQNVVNNESKSNEIITYLEGKIPLDPRRR